jgi:hypothetical protein
LLWLGREDVSQLKEPLLQDLSSLEPWVELDDSNTLPDSWVEMDDSNTLPESWVSWMIAILCLSLGLSWMIAIIRVITIGLSC